VVAVRRARRKPRGLGVRARWRARRDRRVEFRLLSVVHAARRLKIKSWRAKRQPEGLTVGARRFAREPPGHRLRVRRVERDFQRRKLRARRVKCDSPGCSRQDLGGRRDRASAQARMTLASIERLLRGVPEEFSNEETSSGAPSRSFNTCGGGCMRPGAAGRATFNRRKSRSAVAVVTVSVERICPSSRRLAASSWRPAPAARA